MPNSTHLTEHYGKQIQDLKEKGAPQWEIGEKKSAEGKALFSAAILATHITTTTTGLLSDPRLLARR